MALFPQFPYTNLHELSLDWLIEQIRQLMKDGTVISVNGMSGIVTLYTEKDVVFPDRAFDPDWSVYRQIATKQAGLKFTGEKFYYITKNVSDEDFTVQEVFTSNNPPPYPVTSVNNQTGDVIISIPVTSVNGRTGNVVLAGDNIPYNIDGSYTIEDIIIPLEKSIGHVIRYNTCSEGVTAGQYVYLIMSGISGRSDGLYKAVNAKSAGTVWTASDLAPVAGGLGALMASNDSAISSLNSKVTPIDITQNVTQNIQFINLHIIKIGQLVFVSGRPDSSIISDNTAIVENLPKSIISLAESGRHPVLDLDSNTIVGQVEIYTNSSMNNSKLLWRNTQSSNKSCNFSFVYIATN